MARRNKEPDEALGPALDGTDQLARLELALRPAPVESEEVFEELEPVQEEPLVLLICGSGIRAEKVASLGRECGFSISVCAPEELPETDPLASLADAVFIAPGYENLVETCEIGKNCFVCIFIAEARECESALCQCLQTDAAYIGVWAGRELRRELFAALKEDGVPDAELQAVCCPMGLGIGAKNPEQDAVAVLAEIMAAHSGVLKRMRHA